MKEINFFNSKISDIKEIKLQEFNLSNSVLFVYDSFKIPIKRMFYIKSKENNIKRGRHAHKRAWQIFILISGQIELSFYDGFNFRNFKIDEGKAFIIPPGIWGEQVYKKKKSTLLILTNEIFDEGEYIRNIDEFRIKKINNEENN